MENSALENIFMINLIYIRKETALKKSDQTCTFMEA